MSSDSWATVVAIDPGGTTGWEVLAVEPDCLVEPEISILASITHRSNGEVTGDEASQVDELIALISCWPRAALLIEDFTLRKFSMGRELLAPVRVTARLEEALKTAEVEAYDDDDAARWTIGYPLVAFGNGERGEVRMFYQSANLAMTTVTDERMKDWGLWTIGKQHARDATRHSVTFMRRAKERPRLRAAAWPHIYAENG